MRLPEVQTGAAVDMTGSKDVTLLRILTILLDLQPCEGASDRYGPWREGEYWGDKVTVGQALDQCYRFKVLEEPDKQDTEGFRDNVSDLVLALRLMNV